VVGANVLGSGTNGGVIEIPFPVVAAPYCNSKVYLFNDLFFEFYRVHLDGDNLQKEW